MIKMLLTGVWVCAVTLGAVYFSVQMSAPSVPVDEAARKRESMELVRGEAITVPVIREGAVRGYFLSRISFMMDKQKIKGVELPVNELATDELFTLLVGNSMVDISNISSFDLEAFRARLRDGMNNKLGDDFVSEVLVEQLDYLAKDDVRINNSQPQKQTMTPVKIIEGDAAANPGH